MIYIIADDLTGSTDTGVKLSKLGYRVMVDIKHLSSKYNRLVKMDERIDVLVIDTETRDLPVTKARVMMANILNDLPVKSDDFIYKKIDSTMRGNIGCEIEEIMKKLDTDICIFTPALPVNKRTVVGGFLLVQNEPLGITEYYNGELSQGEASYIPDLLKEQTALPVGLIELKEIVNGGESILERIEELYKEGKKIIVMDAVNENNLENIVESSLKLKKSVLFTGSAGLAKYLFKSANLKTDNSKPAAGGQQDRFLVVGGSRNILLEKQVDFLKKNLLISDLKINISEILSDGENSFYKYFIRAKDALAISPYLVIRSDPKYKAEGLLENQLSFRELEVVIRDFLGKLSTALVKDCQINNLVITGGDTAKGVCEIMGIDKLEIKDELLPGIPISRVSSKEYNDLKLITKAGGFGEIDAFYKLIRKLERKSF